eukprot:1603489-Rhodomonas_salina.2
MSECQSPTIIVVHSLCARIFHDPYPENKHCKLATMSASTIWMLAFDRSTFTQSTVSDLGGAVGRRTGNDPWAHR